MDTIQSILAKPISFGDAEKRAEKVQALFHISEHLHNEIMNDEQQNKHIFIGYWNPC